MVERVRINDGVYDQFDGDVFGKGILPLGEDYLEAHSNNGDVPEYFLGNTQRPCLIRVEGVSARRLLSERRIRLGEILRDCQTQAITRLEQIPEGEAQQLFLESFNEKRALLEMQRAGVDRMQLQLLESLK